MSYFENHLQNCSYCSNNTQPQKPTIRVKIKGAASRQKEKKLAELSNIIKGISYSPISYPSTKSASNIESKSQKLKELAKLVRGS